MMKVKEMYLDSQNRLLLVMEDGTERGQIHVTKDWCTKTVYLTVDELKDLRDKEVKKRKWWQLW